MIPRFEVGVEFQREFLYEVVCTTQPSRFFYRLGGILTDWSPQENVFPNLRIKSVSVQDMCD